MAGILRPPGRAPFPFPLYPLLLALSLVASLTWADVAPSLLEEPQSALLSGDRQVSLQCQVAPPGATVRWLFQGRPLDPASHEGLVVEKGRLVFDPPSHTASNVGSYRCQATSGLGSILSRAAVLSLPVLEPFPPGPDLWINTTEGGFAVLPCKLPHSLPPARAVFVNEAGQLVDTSRDDVYQLPTGSLVLSHVRRSDSGHFRCVAVNPATNRNVTSAQSVRLEVAALQPGTDGTVFTRLLESSAGEVTVQIGQAAILECPTAAFPKPRVRWSKYSGALSKNRAQVKHGNLHLKNVRLGDGGTYLCEVEAESTRRVVLLNVQELPTVQVEQNQMEVVVGQKVDLQCKVRGYPEVKVSWFHNAQQVQRALPVAPEGSTFPIAKASLTDAGVYQCLASNNASTAYATVTLQVVPPSTPTGGKTGVSSTGTSGDANNAEGDTKNSPSRKKDRRRKKKKKGRRKNLKGRKNGRKNRKHDGKVKLVPPSRPAVTQLSETSVMLNWTVPDNEGLPVTFFRVQYKEVAPKKGQWQTDDTEIDPTKRRYEVARLKAGGAYKFRIAAVYSNNDNKHSPNSQRFQLTVEPRKEPRPPEARPTIVEVKPIVYENIYALHIKWHYIPVDTSPVEGFFIKYKEWEDKGGSYKDVPLLGMGMRTHLLTHLKPDTYYAIKMQCFNSAGNSKYSNEVVARTNSTSNRQSPPFPFPTDSLGEDRGGRDRHPEGDTDPSRDGKDSDPVPPRSDTQSNSEMLYMILGIVLGAMLLLLVVFMTMCWWRQRQQRRMMGMNGAMHAKFQDQAQRIYSDSMRKKYMNGYPLNGLNGLIANGHGPNHKVNINVNPMSEVESSGQTTGQPLPNGHAPHLYGPHGSTSDNNFNSICHGKPAHTTHSGSGDPSFHGNQADSDSEQDEDLADEDSVMLQDQPQLSPPYPPSLSRPPYASNPELAPRVSPRLRLPVSFEHLHTVDGGPEGERYPRGGYSGREGGYAPCPQHVSEPHGSRHRRRRRRPPSREHSTKDQATNTDLSSNEGTIEFTTFNRSPTGSDHSRTFTNHATQCSELTQTSEAL